MEDRAKALTTTALSRLMTSLNEGHSETLKTYLRTMAKFHRYSWFNSILIWMQKPEASHVAGFRKWPQLGRHVKEGEKGIMILAPILSKKPPINGQAKDDPDAEVKRTAQGFKGVFVFDISQTDGRELPGIGKRSGEPGIYSQRLIDLAEKSGFKVTEHSNLNGAHGRCRLGSIELLEGLAPAEKFGVLAHEVAHALLHLGANNETKPRVVRETEAEAVAFVVCEAVGITNGSASADYLGLYQSDSKLLTQSLHSIQKASKQILQEILD